MQSCIVFSSVFTLNETQMRQSFAFLKKQANKQKTGLLFFDERINQLIQTEWSKWHTNQKLFPLVIITQQPVNIVAHSLD